MFSAGNPSGAMIYLILLETLSLPFLFLAIKKLLNQKTAWISLVLYTTSYLMISSSRWLVNVTPILAFTNVLIYLLTQKVTKTNSLLVGLTIGCIAQFNAAIGPFLLPFAVFYYFKKNKYLLPLTFIGFLLPAIPLIIFDFRHAHLISKAIISFFLSSQGSISPSLVPNLRSFVSQVGSIFVPIYPMVGFGLFILGLLSIISHPKRSFFLSYIVLPLIFWSLIKRGLIPFFLTPLYVFAIVLVSFFLSRLNALIISLCLISLVFVNLRADLEIYTPTNALIPIGDQNVITLSDRIKVLDYLYTNSEGKSFSIWFYNLPYFQDYAWEYLLSWYAGSKYGYLPEKTSSFDRKDLKSSQYFYAVYEEDHDKPQRLADWILDATVQFGPVIQTTKFRDLTVLQFAKIKAD